MQVEKSIHISKGLASVFSVYANVSEWSQWDPEVDSASLYGSFVKGTLGKIKPKGAPESKM